MAKTQPIKSVSTRPRLFGIMCNFSVCACRGRASADGHSGPPALCSYAAGSLAGPNACNGILVWCVSNPHRVSGRSSLSVAFSGSSAGFAKGLVFASFYFSCCSRENNMTGGWILMFPFQEEEEESSLSRCDERSSHKRTTIKTSSRGR